MCILLLPWASKKKWISEDSKFFCYDKCNQHKEATKEWSKYWPELLHFLQQTKMLPLKQKNYLRDCLLPTLNLWQYRKSRVESFYQEFSIENRQEKQENTKAMKTHSPSTPITTDKPNTRKKLIRCKTKIFIEDKKALYKKIWGK